MSVRKVYTTAEVSYSIAEAARVLGVSRRALQVWCSAGDVAGAERDARGVSWRIPESWVVAEWERREGVSAERRKCAEGRGWAAELYPRRGKLSRGGWRRV